MPKWKTEDVSTNSISETPEPVNISERIAELEKQYNELPLQDSREGIEIRRKISDLQAQMEVQQETEAPQMGGTDVQDSIGGKFESCAIPEENAPKAFFVMNKCPFLTVLEI